MSRSPGTGLPDVPAARPLPALIDHTLLRPDGRLEDVERLLDEAVGHQMAAAVLLPRWVPLAARRLEGTGVAVCSVVGFPLGHEYPEVLFTAATRLASEGADELDMVISTGALASGLLQEVGEEIASVVEGAHLAGRDRVIKVIMETHLLEDDLLAEGCRIAAEEGAHFVKTTTGFTGGGATPEEVRRLKRFAGDRLRVKASSGIRTLTQAQALVDAGADRLGTSAGARIADEWERMQGNADAV